MSPLPISYTHDSVEFCGRFLPPIGGSGRRAGVMIVPDVMGPDTPRVLESAERIAAMGYGAMVVDVYGLGRPPASRDEALGLMRALLADRALLRSRARTALAAFASLPEIDATRLVAMGYCFGGTAALELARDGAPLVGTISVHGGLATPRPEDAARISGKVLALHGADDPSVPSDHVTGFMTEMRNANVDWQLVQYGGARHGFSNPLAGEAGSPGIAYNQRADNRSRIAIREFLMEVFA